ncbi:MAG: putative metal-dependent hydrolase, partial [Bryobacteraceae bacterium]|nr:putative metal-dependent hydrolase [Bryobacteraceae bacterium]
MTDLRYPIGKFTSPTEITTQDLQAAVDDIAALPAELRAETSGLTDNQLDTPYRVDGWTIRQVVHHVADSHINSYQRFRLALTEDEPTIKPYDEAAWAMLPDARHEEISVSLELLDALHRRWA